MMALLKNLIGDFRGGFYYKCFCLMVTVRYLVGNLWVGLSSEEGCCWVGRREVGLWLSFCYFLYKIDMFYIGGFT